MNALSQTTAVVASWQTDPGHGWLMISEDQLRLVGMKPEDFSPFSYKKYERIEHGAAAPGRWFYALEEDLDAAMFLAEAKRQNIPVITSAIHKNTDHYIRTWDSINGRTWEQWRSVRDDIVERYARH